VTRLWRFLRRAWAFIAAGVAFAWWCFRPERRDEAAEDETRRAEADAVAAEEVREADRAHAASTARIDADRGTAVDRHRAESERIAGERVQDIDAWLANRRRR
jgi:hypothetical protein